MSIKGSQERDMARKILRAVALSGSVSKPQAEGTAAESGWRQTLAFVQAWGRGGQSPEPRRTECLQVLLLPQQPCKDRLKQSQVPLGTLTSQGGSKQVTGSYTERDDAW